MNKSLGLLTASILVTSVSACSLIESVGDSGLDRPTTLAMESCGISETENPGDGQPLYSRPAEDSEKVFIDGNNLESLQRDSDNAEGMNVDAEAASQLDPRWDDLAVLTNSTFIFLAQLVRLRESSPSTRMSELWPEVNAEGDDYNEANDKIDVICKALLLNVLDGKP